MLFTPSTHTYTPIDPIERHRIESGRPATRAEVIQRQRRHIIEDALAMNVNHDSRPARGNRFDNSFLPDALTGIRRSLSRMLTTAGHRIGPEAA